ncbi:MAG TPA: NUDIX domain-containing protein [Candidatus Saccharimonadales bacterium]|nr:NUDIX domain-containing protein [Candidatus Saccharimonadales bacterium]
MITAYDIEKNPIEVDEKNLVMKHNVYGIAIKGKEILVVPQQHGKGFDFPGGHVEPGEHHLDALRREFFEETGLDIEVAELLCADTVFFKHPERLYATQHIGLIYAVTVTGGKISTDNFSRHEKTYASKAKFVTLDELKTLQYTSGLYKQLPTIIAYVEQHTKKA